MNETCGNSRITHRCYMTGNYEKVFIIWCDERDINMDYALDLTI